MSEWAEPSTGHAQAAEREEAGPSAGSRPGAGRRRGGAECRDAAQEYSPRTGRPPRGGGRALQWFLPRGRAKGVAGYTLRARKRRATSVSLSRTAWSWRGAAGSLVRAPQPAASRRARSLTWLRALVAAPRRPPLSSTAAGPRPPLSLSTSALLQRRRASGAAERQDRSYVPGAR